MRTVESIVACHVAVRERALAGLPAWDKTVKIKDLLESDSDSNAHIVTVAHTLAERLKAGLPEAMLDFHSDSFDQEIEEIIGYFAELRVDDEPDGQLVEYFDDWLSQLYDWADANRVWFN